MTKKQKSNKKVKKISLWAGIAVAIIVVGVFAVIGIGKLSELREQKRIKAYDEALELLADEQWDAAYQAFLDLGDYKDSKTHLNTAKSKVDQENKIAIEKKNSYVSGLFTLLIIGTAVCWFVFGRFVGPYVDWRKKQTEWDKKFESYSDFGVQDRFLNECVEYEKRFLDVVADCSKVYDQEQAKYENLLAQIHSEYAEKSSKTQAELDNVTEQLNAVTLIQPDLFDNAASISKLLRTQRADTLKEAINLAIEEERKENQERERREEARRQEAILEEQAYQTRMHERAMEQAAERQAAEARAHAAAMEAQARAQTAETEKLRKELEKQNGTRKY